MDADVLFKSLIQIWQIHITIPIWELTAYAYAFERSISQSLTLFKHFSYILPKARLKGAITRCCCGGSKNRKQEQVFTFLQFENFFKLQPIFP